MAAMLFRKRAHEPSEEEVRKILDRLSASGSRPQIDWQVGDAVVATAGPFKGMRGTVVAVEAQRHALRTSMKIYGREIPIVLGFDDAGRP